MTNEVQIKGEKLQYHINREAAKISALSSGKIDKYEYLTGEEILPSNQQQIIEQAKFTYSPLGKAFEKQTKTIEDQVKKEIKAIDRNKLIYKYKGNTSDADFSEYCDAIDLINKIKNGDVSLKQSINDQYEVKSKLVKIKKGNPKRKSKTNLDVMKNVDNLYDSRQAVINFFIEYTERVSEAKFRSKQKGTGLKILTPNQMLKIKAGNNSKSLLNEIRQIVYSLYRSKEITKKVYNNIIKSIKV